MTRVLMIAPTPFFADRGCHVRIYEEAKCITRLGIELLIWTYPIGDDPPRIPIKRIAKVSGYERLEAGPSWPRLYLDAHLLKEAYKECARFKPDLIHAHLHEGCLIGAVLRARFKLPLVFDYQGSLYKESLHHGFIKETGVLASAFKAVEQWLDKIPDRLIVSAKTMATPLVSRGLCVETVPDGVDPDMFAPGAADPDLKQKLGIPPGRPLAVYLGVLSQYQGTDIILKAAKYLLDASSPVHFLVMGYPEPQYKAAAKELGVDKMVTFTGRLNYFESAKYLRLGDVALAPKLARTEGNGKVILYMACGLATVAFDLPINREIMGDTAKWVAPSDDRDQCAKGFADALTGLIDDPDQKKALADAGLTRAREELSLERQGERLAAVYESVLGGRA